MAARPGVDLGVAGLLGEVDRRLPAPVGEDAEQQPAGQRRAAVAERVEPAPARGRGRPAGCRRSAPRTSATAAKTSSASICARISTFCSRADSSVPSTQIQVITTIDATVSTITHGVDLGQRVQPDGQQGEHDGHVGQRADDQDAGHRDRPAADPAEPRPQRAGDPRERRPAVVVDPVQAANADAISSIGTNEASSTPGALTPSQRHERADDRGQRVRRRRRGQPDHQGVDEADGPRPQRSALADRDGRPGGVTCTPAMPHSTVIAARRRLRQAFRGSRLCYATESVARVSTHRRWIMRILLVGAGGVGSAVTGDRRAPGVRRAARRRRLRPRPRREGGRRRRRPAVRRRAGGRHRRGRRPGALLRRAPLRRAAQRHRPAVRHAAVPRRAGRAASTTWTWPCRCRTRTRSSPYDADRRQARRRAVRAGRRVGGRRAAGPGRHRRRAGARPTSSPATPPTTCSREIDELGVRDGVEPDRARPRLRAVVLHLDDDRGVPQPAGGLGARPGLVHHRAVQRAGGLRLPRGHRPGRVRERGARGGAPHAALGRRAAGHLQVRPRAREFIDVLKALHKTGLDSTTPIRVGDVEVSPRDVVAAALPDPAGAGRADERQDLRRAVGQRHGHRRPARGRSTSTTWSTTPGRWPSTAPRRWSGRPPSTRWSRWSCSRPASWRGSGVLGPEAFDAVPFLDLLTAYGSPWGMREGG